MLSVGASTDHAAASNLVTHPDAVFQLRFEVSLRQPHSTDDGWNSASATALYLSYCFLVDFCYFGSLSSIGKVS